MEDAWQSSDGVGRLVAGQQVAMVAVSLATVTVGVFVLPTLPPGAELLLAVYAVLVATVLNWGWLRAGDDETADVEPEESVQTGQSHAD